MQDPYQEARQMVHNQFQPYDTSMNRPMDLDKFRNPYHVDEVHLGLKKDPILHEAKALWEYEEKKLDTGKDIMLGIKPIETHYDLGCETLYRTKHNITPKTEAFDFMHNEAIKSSVKLNRLDDADGYLTYKDPGALKKAMYPDLSHLLPKKEPVKFLSPDELKKAMYPDVSHLLPMKEPFKYVPDPSIQMQVDTILGKSKPSSWSKNTHSGEYWEKTKVNNYGITETLCGIKGSNSHTHFGTTPSGETEFCSIRTEKEPVERLTFEREVTHAISNTISKVSSFMKWIND